MLDNKLAGCMIILQNLHEQFEDGGLMRQGLKALEQELEQQGKHLEALEQKLPAQCQCPQAVECVAVHFDSSKQDSHQAALSSLVMAVKQDVTVPVYVPIAKRTIKWSSDSPMTCPQKKLASNDGYCGYL